MDPVEQGEDGNWYFWIEMWADKIGPFDTEQECRDRLKEHAESL